MNFKINKLLGFEWDNKKKLAKICVDCNARGTINKRVCPRCNGIGRIFT